MARARARDQAMLPHEGRCADEEETVEVIVEAVIVGVLRLTAFGFSACGIVLLRLLLLGMSMSSTI